MKFLRRIAYTLTPILVIGLPLSASAITLLPPCTQFGNCTACDFITLFANWAQLILGLISAVSVLTIMIGGLFWIMSAGNPERVKRGQQILVGSVIGVVLVLTGFLIINFTISALLGNQGYSENAQLFGTDWDTYCEEGTGVTAVSDCGADGVVDGQSCAASTCPDRNACICSAGSCVSACVSQGEAADIETECAEGCSDDQVDLGTALCPLGASCCAEQ